jgi:Bacterial Ig domain
MNGACRLSGPETSGHSGAFLAGVSSFVDNTNFDSVFAGNQETTRMNGVRKLFEIPSLMAVMMLTVAACGGGGGGSSPTPVNNPPVAVNDSLFTPQDTSLTTAANKLTQNDTDADGNTLTVTGVGNASNGTVAFSAGNVIFTPSPNFSGSATYEYTVSDGSLNDTGQVTIDVVSATETGALFATDGGGGNASTKLYTLDPANGQILSTPGLIGYPVTGLAIQPGTGVLYGVTTGTDPRLITINKATGTGTVVGSLFNPLPSPCLTGPIADITFASDGTLYGWSEHSDDLVTINLITGVATAKQD